MDAETLQEAAEKVAVAYLRSTLLPEVKIYMDLSNENTMVQYVMRLEEWKRSDLKRKTIYENDGFPVTSSYNKPTTGTRKTVTCFQCGKFGHISRDCRSKLAGDSSARQTTAVPTPTATSVVPTQTEKKPIICFSCWQVGHKSPQCPKRQQGSVKRVEITLDSVKALGKNEVMGEMMEVPVPITLDSGAQVTVVPEEAVKQCQFTGQTTKFNGIIEGDHSGKLANVVIQIGSDSFARTAVAVPGKDISWTAAMSFDMTDIEELQRLHHHLNSTKQLPEEETHFLPPCMENGKF